MSLHFIIEKVALVAAVVLPFFNIPLILRVIQRKSSDDISLVWAYGVWACITLMAPSSFTSPDIVWRTFSIINFIFFTIVVAVVFKYRKK